jgi:hypothetical protein
VEDPYGYFRDIAEPEPLSNENDDKEEQEQEADTQNEREQREIELSEESYGDEYYAHVKDYSDLDW